jgi:hypothetical protein
VNLFEPDLDPSPAILRRFASLWLPLFAGGGGLLYALRGGSPRVAWAGAAVAVLSTLVGLVRPALARPVYVGLSRLTAPLGRILSVVLLAAVYFCVFTPFGLLRRLLPGAATYPERIDRKAGSYWRVRGGGEDGDRWDRPY